MVAKDMMRASSEGTIVLLGIQLPYQAGGLGLMRTEMGEAGGNIDTVRHDRSFRVLDAASVRVEVDFELSRPSMIMG